MESRRPELAARYPVENAMRETPNSYPPHSLKLKIGSLIILLRNWSVKDGLCNGTRLRVIQMNNHSIRGSIYNGPFEGREHTFSRYTFTPQKDLAEYRLIRTQFPFRLAFSMTINKSQGQTFDRIGMLLNSACWTPGQFYVGVSRCRRFEDVKIQVKQIDAGDDRQGVVGNFPGIYTNNVVDRSILN